jgi:hypothetical protein
MTARELSARLSGRHFLIKHLHKGCVASGPYLFMTMPLKIDKIATKHSTVIRLFGRLRREHSGIVTKQIQSLTGEITLDLGELALISVEGVRFLNACQDQGIVVANASPHVTDWMKRERNTTDDGPC